VSVARVVKLSRADYNRPAGDEHKRIEEVEMSPNAEKWQPTPTFWLAGAALVIALAAFVVSVSGIATASPKVIVRKGDIAPGAVTAKALAKGAVTAPKIQKGTITGAKLASGSVTSEKLASGSVTASSLGVGAVTAQAIAAGAVTKGAIAPGSIGASQLGELEVVVTPVADQDTIAHNSEWTASNREIAACKSGGIVMGGGFYFSIPTNGESSWIEELPINNSEAQGVAGRFTSDAGGAASGNVVATCLKK
jgi:hypothetical protein